MTLFEKRSKRYREFVDGMPHNVEVDVLFCLSCFRSSSGFTIRDNSLPWDSGICWVCLRWNGRSLN